MTITIAAIADTHISARPGGRLGEANRVLLWTLDDAAKRGATVVAIAGDLYHAGSTPVERIIARALLGKASDRFPVVLVGGNHDAEQDLTILDAFRTDHPITVVEQPRVIQASGVAFGCIPHLRRDVLVRRIIAAKNDPTPDALRAAARAEIAKIGAELAALDKGIPRIGLAHAMIAGSKMSNDQPAQGRGELDLTSEDFAALGADAYVFGHVHRGQTWIIDGKPAAYPGSPYATTYGELGPKKYLLLHLDGRRAVVELRETPATRLILLLGTHGPGGMSLAYGREHDAEGVAVAPAGCAGADVRLRYVTNAREREAIAAAAAAARAEILAAGAATCKLEGIPERTARARAPGFRRAQTLHERLDAYWTASGKPPARRERVLALLDEIATAAPEEQGGLVRFERFACRELFPFTGEVTLPIADLPPFTALMGENGVGKSTLIALMLASMREESPTHGVLDSLVTGEGAYLEVDVATAAARWTIRHDFASKSVTIHPEQGEALSFGRAPFREWARANLPDPAGLLNYAFLPPRKLGLVELYDGTLKAALLALLGASSYETRAGLARKRATAIETALAGKRGELKALPKENVQALEAELATAQTAVECARVVLSERRARAATRASWEAARAARAIADAKRSAAEMAIAAAQRDHDEATEIREAVRRSAAIAAEKREIDAEIRAIDAAEATIAADLRAIQAIVIEARRTVSADRAQIEKRRAEERAALAAGERAAELPALEAALDGATAALAEATRDRAGLRIDALRGTLEQVRATASRASLKASIGTASRALREVAKTSKEALEQDAGAPPADVAGAAERRSTALLALERARDEIAAAPSLEQVRQHVRTLEFAIARSEGAIAGGARRERELQDELTATGLRRLPLLQRLGPLQTEGAKLAPLAARAAQADSTDAARAALEATHRAATAEAITAAERFAALGEEPPSLPSGSVEQAERSATETAARRALAEDRLARARAAAERGAALAAEIADLEQAHEDVATLAAALGKDGVQAIAVELAGEDIAEDATARLHAAIGPIWTIEFRGTRQDARGKRTIEQARWLAKNHVDGKEREIRACSEGEKALLGTAVALAFIGTMVERWGTVERPTFSFDETAAPLRGDKVEAWFGMLQRAAEDYHVGTVLLVPPDGPALAEMTDARVMVRASGLLEESAQ